jgi:hypothetical protein
VKIKKLRGVVSVGVMMALLSGCDDPKPAIHEVIQKINAWGAPYGIQILLPTPADKQAQVRASPTPSKLTAGELAKENSELLAEMIKVIFDEKEIDDKADFGSLVLTLNQGASLEGVYRGIIMGSRYRALETKSQGASPTELKAFAIEMAELQSTMKNPSVFEASVARKPPTIEMPDGSGSEDTVVAHEGSQEVTKKRETAEIRDELLETFIGASGFTLKRTLGDEALKKFDEMNDDRVGLAEWYGHLALRLAASKVDFGLELRSQPDFDFHYRFAQTMSLDRVKWEVLNRYHRYLNFTATQ